MTDFSCQRFIEILVRHLFCTQGHRFITVLSDSTELAAKAAMFHAAATTASDSHVRNILLRLASKYAAMAEEYTP